MALKPFNSVGGFSVGEIPANVIDSNKNFTGNTANFTGNLTAANANLGNLAFANFFTGTLINGTSNITTINNGNIALTAGGNTTLVVTSNGANVVGTFDVTGNLTVANASLGNLITANFANISSDTITNNLTVNLGITGNYANFSGNVVVPNLTVNLEFQANTANFDGNVVMDNWLYVANTANVGNLRTNNLLYANGVPWDLQEAAGANTQIQYNINNNFAASANFTYDDSAQLFTVIGNSQFNNANLGNLARANFVNVASNLITSNATVN